MIEEKFLEDLENWLIVNKQFKVRSARDVKCRLKRLDSISPLSICEENEYYLYDVEKKREFRDLSTSVKSQLRRSKRIFDEYRESSEDD
ncbi:hypothetical protein [Enterococcus sp. AZ058]|uniref:hypothetical protein n=1 Tax=unclassified Enterococcus TaxID=2608891 RepID=UPI003D2AE7EC